MGAVTQEAHEEHKGCFALSNLFKISYKLMNRGKQAIFSSCSLPGSLFDAHSYKHNYSVFIALEQEQGLRI